MGTSTSQSRRVQPQIEPRWAPPASTTPPGSKPGWRKVLARFIGRDREHDAATFFRLEYRGQERSAAYTTARDAQSSSELLGPPPLGQ